MRWAVLIFFKNIKQHIKTVRIIVVVGLLIGLPANYMLAVYMSKYPADYWILNHNGVMQTIYYALGVLPLSLVYTGILMLVYQRISGKKFLSVFAPVGKMAFSNYIFQTLVGSYVFLGAGLGYISKVGPFCYTILGIAVFPFTSIVKPFVVKAIQLRPGGMVMEKRHL
ncbi:MAG: DUF418 domain-containing protein [Chitinophagaceae bacterium]|nr:DUF418 domain-containing protein [Chitinophagaceae bacterium]